MPAKRKRTPLPVDGIDLTNNEAILSSREVCGWLKISYPTLTRWRSEGSGPPYIKASARSFLYRVGDVRKWMAAHKQNAVVEVSEVVAA